MRFLLRVTIPVDTGNEALRSGKFIKLIQSVTTELKPEALYFVAENGERTAYFFIDIQNPSQIPAVAEPFFHALNAAVEFFPAMNADDLKKSAPAIEQVIKKYG